MAVTKDWIERRKERLARTDEIIETVNRFGLTKAADILRTPKSTLCTFIKSQGYVRKAQYVKEVHSLTTA